MVVIITERSYFKNRDKWKRGTIMKYVCEVCGYVYDEEVEGVKFEDLPDDYECPLCSVGKDQFAPEE